MPYPVAAARGGLGQGGAAVPWYRNGSALSNSIVALWKLDEASGNRADSVGSNTLTDNNAVGSAAGAVYPLAASFSAASSQFLSIPSNSILQTGNIDWWICAWFRPGNVSAIREIASHFISASRGFILYHNGAGQMIFTNGGSVTGGSVSINTVYCAIAWFDSGAGTLNLSLNNGTVVSAAKTIDPIVSTASFRIGAEGDSSNFYEGRIGPVILGKHYIPTPTDRTNLNNSFFLA